MIRFEIAMITAREDGKIPESSKLRLTSPNPKTLGENSSSLERTPVSAELPIK